MKNIFLSSITFVQNVLDRGTFAIILVLIIFSAISPEKASAQYTQVSFQVFYDQLSPYGQWVDYPSYGYVWIPNAGNDFAPYSTDGHWVYTDYGWTWVSNYPWGWAPFHYGRWGYDNTLGWFWVPDETWGPAWVSWRRTDGYAGWEPLGPGISISLSFARSYDRNNDHWMFVRDRDLDRPNIGRYQIDRTDRERVIRSSTVVNNTYVDHSRRATYISGPSRGVIQKSTGRIINPVTVRDYNKPGHRMSNKQLQIYRPEVKKRIDNRQRPAPSKVLKPNEVRRPTGKNQGNKHKDGKPKGNGGHQK